MSENQKSILVDLILGLIISVLIFVFKFDSGYSLLHLLSDCTFVPAVILLGLGGLRFCTNSGSLDMLGYGFETLRNTIRNMVKIDGGPKEDYFSYTQRVAQERKPYGHYLIAGLVFMVLSIGFVVAYNLIGS